MSLILLYSASLPLVPAGGIPKKLARDVRTLISPKRGRVRKVKIEWGAVKSGNIFELDRNDKRIILNSAYRSDILAGRSASQSDVPTFKLLLFLLLEKDLDQGKVSALQRERLDLINGILIEAVAVAKVACIVVYKLLVSNVEGVDTEPGFMIEQCALQHGVKPVTIGRLAHTFETSRAGQGNWSPHWVIYGGESFNGIRWRQQFTTRVEVNQRRVEFLAYPETTIGSLVE